MARSSTHTTPERTDRRRRNPRGQAMAEFAVILPILLALVGGGIDFARAFEGAMTLQTASRNAAEAVAYAVTDPSLAEAHARAVVCAETQRLPGFVAGSGGNVATCTNPVMTVTYTTDPTAPGANVRYPLVTVSVTTSLAFDLVVPWPLLPNGAWTLGTTQSFAIMQGR
jgi:Flp pilus assembly protein TadG